MKSLATSTRVKRFNSQPLEGGCLQDRQSPVMQGCFNSQPLEGGCFE